MSPRPNVLGLCLGSFCVSRFNKLDYAFLLFQELLKKSWFSYIYVFATWGLRGRGKYGDKAGVTHWE